MVFYNSRKHRLSLLVTFVIFSVPILVFVAVWFIAQKKMEKEEKLQARTVPVSSHFSTKS